MPLGEILAQTDGILQTSTDTAIMWDFGSDRQYLANKYRHSYHVRFWLRQKVSCKHLQTQLSCGILAPTEGNLQTGTDTAIM